MSSKTTATVGTSVSALAHRPLSPRHHYGIPGEQVDGMDVAVHQAVEASEIPARGGAIILEMLTAAIAAFDVDPKAAADEVNRCAPATDRSSRQRRLTSTARGGRTEQIEKACRDIVAEAAQFSQTA
jgi:TPP-dependent pyruvate/acetoin dehydrogenase alpha subunit